MPLDIPVAEAELSRVSAEAAAIRGAKLPAAETALAEEFDHGEGGGEAIGAARVFGRDRVGTAVGTVSSVAHAGTRHIVATYTAELATTQGDGRMTRYSLIELALQPACETAAWYLMAFGRRARNRPACWSMHGLEL